MTEREIWRAIPSVDGAIASSLGRVMVKPFVAGAGRKQYGGVPTVGCWDGSRFIWRCGGRTYKVARLICEAFKGPPPSYDSVCMHMDEDSRNNAPSNLAWGTQKENLNAPGFLAYCKRRTGENSPIVKGRRKQAA
jgi:hypothetical protein